MNCRVGNSRQDGEQRDTPHAGPIMALFSCALGPADCTAGAPTTPFPGQGGSRAGGVAVGMTVASGLGSGALLTVA